MNHVASLRSYLAVFAALLVLTALTVFVAGVDLGWVNTPLALGIAAVKAVVVATWFMHLKTSGRFIALVASAGVLWLLIMIALTLADYVSRQGIAGWG